MYILLINPLIELFFRRIFRFSRRNISIILEFPHRNIPNTRLDLESWLSISIQSVCRLLGSIVCIDIYVIWILHKQFLLRFCHRIIVIIDCFLNIFKNTLFFGFSHLFVLVLIHLIFQTLVSLIYHFIFNSIQLLQYILSLFIIILYFFLLFFFFLI